MSALRLSVVIPSWNGREALQEHLPSVLRAAGEVPSHEVIVADDASNDDTADLLRRGFPEVRLVSRPSRGGFAAAANDGIAAASGEVVLLLNNDMEVQPGAVARLTEAAASDAGVFAHVPRIVRAKTGLDESATRLLFRRGIVSTDLGAGPGGAPAYACGGAMAFRRRDFLAVGGFDLLFSPFYWEDVDLSYRARKRGWAIALVPEARVDHDHGRTIGRRFDQTTIEILYERNRLIFTWKNVTDAGLFRRHLATLPAKTIWDLAAHPPFVRGLKRALAVRREILARRRIEHLEAVRSDGDLLER